MGVWQRNAVALVQQFNINAVRTVIGEREQVGMWVLNTRAVNPVRGDLHGW